MRATAQRLYAVLHDLEVPYQGCRFTEERCAHLAPLVDEIEEWKRRRNAVILAHSYVSADIVYGVADFVGDSFQLSKDAAATDAEVIVFAAVRFMAETAKLLNPDKRVFVPAADPGCSLADSITADQVADLRRRYPDHTFVCYINTTAAVKAECDVCVTSSNVYDIVAAIPGDKVFFLPDRLMGANVQQEMRRRGVDKQIALWDGSCYVHQDYDADTVRKWREQVPGIRVLAHPECSPHVVGLADFVGSTAQMSQHIRAQRPPAVLLLTECGLADRLRAEVPGVRFVGSCSLCRYMKSNSLEAIAQVLRDPDAHQEVVLDPDVAARARRCVDAMFAYAASPPGPRAAGEPKN